MLAPNSAGLAASIRPEALRAPASGIVEVADYGRDRPGLIPLWVGEGDAPTPRFIVEAAEKSLRDGETFYTHQAGIPGLRAAIDAYLAQLYGRGPGANRLFVTAGGMHALQIAVRMVAGTGDEVLVPTPAWPNFAGAIGIAGARAVSVPMDRTSGGFALDLERLERAVTPATRAIMCNSPANPTGWTADLVTLGGMLEIARRHGLWIVADEIYGRFHYAGGRAPSFRDLMHADDRVMFVQTFSKNWAMTGWRLGWLEAPAELGEIVVNLVQYSTSGIPVFAQRAGVAALERGEALVSAQVELARRNRAALCSGLGADSRFNAPPPPGAFYLFFGISGMGDARAAALKLIDRANIGLAPGTAFGPGGETFLRLCYLRRAEDIDETIRRLLAADLA